MNESLATPPKRQRVGNIETEGAILGLISQIKKELRDYTSNKKGVFSSFYFDDITFKSFQGASGETWKIRISNHKGDKRWESKDSKIKSFVTTREDKFDRDPKWEKFGKNEELIFLTPSDKVEYKGNKDITLEDIIYDISGFKKIKKN